MDPEVLSSFIESRKTVTHRVKKRRGCYLYVLEGNPVKINDQSVPVLGAAMITDDVNLKTTAKGDTEILLVDVLLE